MPPETESATPGRIVLVRHGETAWSLTGQHTGVTDLPLTAHGEEQATATGAALDARHFDLVLSSPRIRALTTARLAGYGDQVEVDPNLAEWDYGAYEGRTTHDIVAERGPWNIWTDGVPPGQTPGETPDEVQARVLRVISRVRDVARSGGDALVFAHAHILRAFAAAWVELPASGGQIFTLSTSTISALGYEHGAPVIVQWNALTLPA
ncbi:histidine phosphatase family protein [Subtercola sp. YIM 133946]|uniref:histidine phosphatase family protein n=1 Tax=Subtercola sp. YIM 133946 TaxID=3118909 RepID=UPI002F926052